MYSSSSSRAGGYSDVLGNAASAVSTGTYKPTYQPSSGGTSRGYTASYTPSSRPATAPSGGYTPSYTPSSGAGSSYTPGAGSSSYTPSYKPSATYTSSYKPSTGATPSSYTPSYTPSSGAGSSGAGASYTSSYKPSYTPSAVPKYVPSSASAQPVAAAPRYVPSSPKSSAAPRYTPSYQAGSYQSLLGTSGAPPQPSAKVHTAADFLGNAGGPSAAINAPPKKTKASQAKKLSAKDLRSMLLNSKVKDYKKMTTLGAGSFGAVYLVKHSVAQTVFAIKQLSKAHVVNTGQLEHVIAERDVLYYLDSDWYPRTYASFQDADSVYLVLEYVAGGEFYNLLRDKGRMSEDQTRFYAACVVAAFEHLHDRELIYRDLKPENLLVDKDGYLKVTDMGFCKKLPKGEHTFTLCGTPEYLAPEIIQSKGHTGAVDWWTLGILIFEMITGAPPFEHDNQMELYRMIVQGKISFPPYVSAAARDIIQGLLQVDLSMRLGNLKGGTSDVKNHAFFRGLDWDALHARALKAPFPPKLKGDDDASAFDGNAPEGLVPDLGEAEEKANLTKEQVEKFMAFDHPPQGL